MHANDPDKYSALTLCTEPGTLLVMTRA